MDDYQTYSFLKLLDRKGIKYHYEGKWLVVDGNDEGNVYLNSRGITSLPDYIKFKNEGVIDLYNNKLFSLPNHIEFNNNSHIWISNNNLSILPNNLTFNNKLSVNLSHNPLKSLPDTIDQFYDRLDNMTKKYIREKFPDHWVVDKERFGL